MWRSLKHKLRFLFVAITLTGVTIFCSQSKALNAPSPWLMSDNPEFKVKTDDATNFYPTSYAQRGNIDCQNLTFTHRDGDTLPFLPLHIESQQTGCYINTNVGLLDPNGNMHVSDTPYMADTVHVDTTPANVFAFPNSDIYVSNTSSSAAIGSFVWFDHLQTSMQYTRDDFGRIRAVITPHAQIPLADMSGKLLPVMSDNFGVSENGEWAVVDSPGRALLRINLTTLEVLPFADSFEFGNGIGAQLKYAISSDGRYVAVSSKNYTFFRIFDLSTCGTTPSEITSPTTCASRDLDTFFRSKVSDMGGILRMRFLTNDLLDIYATHDISSSFKIGEYFVAAPGTSLTSMDYLALGDSFSSGEGSFNYEIGTDEKDINMCHLSRVSYPYLIAKKLSSNSFHSVACSGATTTNLKGGVGIDKTLSKPNRDNQFITKPNLDSLGNWLPGYQKQLNFVSQNQPNLITLSVIGNDVGFADIAALCVKAGTCFPTYEDQQEVFNLVDSKLSVLKDTFLKIKNAAPNSAKIYAVAYPQIALPTGSCGLNVHMNIDELQFASSLISRINHVVKNAAAQAGIEFADIENAFVGYRLCEAPLGKAAMNGLTAGTDLYKVIGNESFHPTEFGQYLMAQAILAVTHNAGTTPQTDDTNTPSAPLVEVQSTAPKTNRIIRKRIPVTLPKAVITKGQNLSDSLNGITYGLINKSSYSVSIDGLNSGAINASQSGSLDLNIPIPTDTDTGIHDLHITGQDITGSPIDITAIFATSDTTPASSCFVTPASNIDSDQDGIDDACDAIITPAPTQQPSVPAQPSQTLINAQTTNISNPQINSPQYGTYDYQTSYVPLSEESPPQETQPSSIQNIPKLTRDSLNTEASAHPLGFLNVLVALILILLGLAYKYRSGRTKNQKYLYGSLHPSTEFYS